MSEGIVPVRLENFGSLKKKIMAMEKKYGMLIKTIPDTASILNVEAWLSSPCVVVKYL